MFHSTSIQREICIIYFYMIHREFERQCESPSMAKGGFFQSSRIQQQSQPPPPTSRHSQSSSNMQGENTPQTLTAASLIDAIITHQINQSADNSSGNNPSSNNQPTRPGDRLFQVCRILNDCQLFFNRCIF